MATQWTKIGRNAQCPCGSGKKYKKCCLAAEQTTPTGESAEAQLTRLIADGYAHAARQDAVGACRLWREAWKLIEARLRPEMTTCRAVDACMPSGEAFLNWSQDFVMELQNAALADRRLSNVGCSICQRMLDQLTEETELFIVNLKCDLAEFRLAGGDFGASERLLLSVIECHPRTAQGFVHLADNLSRDSPHRDLDRARALLEQAKTLEDADGFDVDARLKHLDAPSA